MSNRFFGDLYFKVVRLVIWNNNEYTQNCMTVFELFYTKYKYNLLQIYMESVRKDTIHKFQTCSFRFTIFRNGFLLYVAFFYYLLGWTQMFKIYFSGMFDFLLIFYTFATIFSIYLIIEMLLLSYKFNFWLSLKIYVFCHQGIVS